MIIEFNYHNHKWNLPKVVQPEIYEYAPGVCCPVCGDVYPNHWSDHNTEGIEGYCETSAGELMLCLECPYCHKKYRYHLDKKYKDGKFDVQHWKDEVALIFELDINKRNEYQKFRIEQL